MRLGLFHPGAMGSALGAQLVAAGHEVFWFPEGRSEASTRRAAAAGLTGTTPEVLPSLDVILCSCAPQGALDIASSVGKSGFTGVYVEANPLSPASLSEATTSLPEATFIDAAVIGPPPHPGGSTHLLLSGPADGTEVVAGLFAGTAVTPMVVGGSVGAASATKSSYALYNKGKAALAVLAFGLAERYGVTEALVAQAFRPDSGALADPGLVDGVAERAWRWGPEFDEIAATLDEAGLEGEVARALRLIWTRLEDR